MARLTPMGGSANSTARVSVVIPTYNRSALVCEAIESALTQTRRAYEIIVVDDGSTDDTPAAVVRFGDAVRYYRQANQGVSAARNAGLAMATGDVVAFLDSDDLWRPHKLALQLAVLEALPQVGHVFSEFDILTSDGSLVPKGSRTWLARPLDYRGLYERTTSAGSLGLSVDGVPGDVPVHLGRIYPHLLHEALVLTSTAMVRRSVLDSSMRFTEGVSMFEDWEFHARVARRTVLAFVDYPTTVNRGHRSAERLTLASRLHKAESYLGLVERVWMADPEFMATRSADVRQAEGRALLAIAREAILVSRIDAARAALRRWRSLDLRERRSRALCYGACAVVPGGRALLRTALRGRTVARLLLGRGHRAYSVNPAA